MQSDELPELHYIAPIANLPSIVQRGLLCHRQAESLNPISVALGSVQERRKAVRIPGGLPLHNYVNLYLNARNPMMYLRKDEHEELVVLRIETRVLRRPGVVVTAGNAARKLARFYSPEPGLAVIHSMDLFAQYWSNSGNPERDDRMKDLRCAEALIPHQLPMSEVFGAYVSCDNTFDRVTTLLPAHEVKISAEMFFQRPGVVNASRTGRNWGTRP